MSDFPNYRIIRDDRVQRVVLRWWGQLQGISDPTDKSSHANVNQRAARAELRRCRTVDSVLLSEAFRNLWQALESTGQRRQGDILAWACVAAALAEVREQPDDKKRTFAACLGSQKEATGKPYVSELRFAQLQKSRDQDSFLRRLRRALALINKKAPVLSLADSILLWYREQAGAIEKHPMHRLAVRWATDYFTAVTAYDK